MSDHSTGRLSDDEVLQLLEDRVEENPEFAPKLARAIAKSLDDDFGWQQGYKRDKLEEISSKLDVLSGDSKNRFETLESKFATFGERQDIFSRELGKVNTRLDSIDGHLGINTDTRRRA